MTQEIWLKSKKYDIPFIILPGYLALILAILLRDYYQITWVSLLLWVLMSTMIDSAHVFVSLFRTYFSKKAQRLLKMVLLVTPILAFTACYSLIQFDQSTYMKFLIYMVAFHYIRQHYGIIIYYFNKTRSSKSSRLINQLAIYSTLIVPLIYWHTVPREFGWYGKIGFYFWDNPRFFELAHYFLILVIALYLLNELLLFVKNKEINLPKNFLFIGLGFSWYYSIVKTDDALTFLLVNNLAHGIPYFAFSWYFYQVEKENKQAHINGKVLMFLAIPVLIAFITQITTDLIFEHKYIEPTLGIKPWIVSGELQGMIAATLGTFAITHYVLDAFIWRRKYIKN